MKVVGRFTAWRRLLALALLAVLPATAAPAPPLPVADATQAAYDHANRDLQVVEDKDCASGKALELRFHGTAVANGGLPVMTSPLYGPLVPGLYRATVRLKMQGMLRSLGTGITVSVAGATPAAGAAPPRIGAPIAARTYYLNDFTAEDAWQDFTLDFEVCPAFLLRTVLDAAAVDDFIKARGELTRASAEQKAALKAWLLAHPRTALPTTEPPGRLAPNVVQQLNAFGATPAQVVVSVSIPANKSGFPSGTRGNSTPFASLRRLLVDTVVVAPLPEPVLVVRDVTAQRAWLRPGEHQRFSVPLHNRSGASQQGELCLRIESGLDGRLALPPVAVTLADGEQRTVTVDWDVPATHPLWGQTAVAELAVGGQVVSQWRTWFTVHPRVVSVMIPYMDSYAAKEGCNFQHPTASKPNVANLLEYWAPTPYDAAGLVPENLDEPFMAGNSGKVESLPKQAQICGALKERGIASVFYCEAHGTGLKAWDLYFDHPEWCAPSEPTSDLFYLKRRDAWPQVRTWALQQQGNEKKNRGEALTDAEKEALAKPGIDKMPDMAHVGFVTLNCLRPEVVDRIIAGHNTLMARVPYLGVRWDSGKPLECLGYNALGENLGKTQAELDQQTVANLARYFKEIRAQHPEFEIGYNGGHGALMGPRKDPFDFVAAAKELDNDPVSRAVLADGGYVLEEAWGHAFEVWNDYKIVARNYLRACRAESAAYLQAGGQHGHMFRDNGVEYTPDDIYEQLFSLLGGAHLCLVNYGPLPESQYDLGVYAARFSEFFWDPKLRQLSGLEDKVHVDSQADIWTTEAGMEKDSGHGTHYYILPLINPPVTEKWLKNRFGQLPAPVKGPLTMTVQVPDGYKGVKAVYDLANSPWPAVQPLKFEADDKEVRFDVPGLVTFKVVVVEFTK